MIKSIKKLTALIALVAVFFSCNQEPSLQTYFVDNELKPGFTTADIPKSVLNIDPKSLSEEEQEALNSIDKLNMLAFVISENNKQQYKEELQKLKNILKAPMYEQLIRGGNDIDGKFMVNFVGDEDHIDELILFGYSDDKGFTVVRVLGDDMSLNKMIKLQSVVQKADIKEESFKEFSKFLKL